jgi:hypothetical protein
MRTMATPRARCSDARATPLFFVWTLSLPLAPFVFILPLGIYHHLHSLILERRVFFLLLCGRSLSLALYTDIPSLCCYIHLFVNTVSLRNLIYKDLHTVSTDQFSSPESSTPEFPDFF